MELFLNIFIIVCMFIIGSLFGSFFSLATYRIPRRLDIVATRSFCTTCKHRLGFFDLIPVLSYVFHLGKCKYCGEKISIRYFLLEVSNGIVFVIFYLLFGYTLTLLCVALAYAIVFTLVGAYIMERQMSEEEREEVKNRKKELKKGVFITELVVAMILFTMLLVSSYIMSRNYSAKSVTTIARSNAVSLAVKNIEMALATDYDTLNSFESEEIISDVKFKVDTSIYKYADQEFGAKDIVKTIQVKVTYMLEGSPYEFELKTLKGKGM